MLPISNRQRRFDKAGRALLRLEEMLNDKSAINKYYIDGLIKRFEFTFEMFWKLLRVLVQEEEIDTAESPRQSLIAAAKAKMITEIPVWEAMLKDRNTTTHTDDEDFADDMLSHIAQYVPLMRTTFDQLQERYGHA